MIRRRDFITLLGGAAAWPLAARAQQGDRVRRIGVLMGFDESDPEGNLRYSAFTRALADLGWTDGRNVRLDLRWAGDNINRIRGLAQELVGLQPDVILTNGTPATAALQRETQAIPIVFAHMGDPVASGIVPRLNDEPVGNITGFASWEPTMGGKWVELLSEIAFGLKRVQSCSILTPLPHRLICPYLRRQLGHSRSCQLWRLFMATKRSKRPSRPLKPLASIVGSQLAKLVMFPPG